MSDTGRTRWIGSAVIGAALAVGALWLAGVTSAPTRAHGDGRADAAGGKDVAIVRCKAAGRAFQVSEYQGSVSTPARKTESCADTLGDLLKVGFAVERTGTSDDADFVVYTLTR